MNSPCVLARAVAAQKDGAFEGEITPLTIRTQKGDVAVEVDEQPGKARPKRFRS